MKNCFFFLLVPSTSTEIIRKVSQINASRVDTQNAMTYNDSKNPLWSLSSLAVRSPSKLGQIMCAILPLHEAAHRISMISLSIMSLTPMFKNSSDSSIQIIQKNLQS